jgi:anti-anti-sigma regulatory factor
LSTPVVKLADGTLAIPLIGTLDSERTQIVMENLLQAIVDQTAQVAIIDITCVPTLDTLTAQHLLKTVAAARLMGADCIISGIGPQLAETLVHLGVELNVVSKATLADALQLAFSRVGRVVVRAPKASNAPGVRPGGAVIVDRIPILRIGEGRSIISAGPPRVCPIWSTIPSIRRKSRPARSKSDRRTSPSASCLARCATF